MPGVKEEKESHSGPENGSKGSSYMIEMVICLTNETIERETGLSTLT